MPEKVGKYETPRSGWKKFIKRLFALNILTLPHYESLDKIEEHTPASTDGCGISIEVATKNVYRHYGYSNPDYYADKYIEASNIVSIMKLLNSEFKIKDWPDHIDRPEKDHPDTIIQQEIHLKDIEPPKKKKKQK